MQLDIVPGYLRTLENIYWKLDKYLSCIIICLGNEAGLHYLFMFFLAQHFLIGKKTSLSSDFKPANIILITPH